MKLVQSSVYGSVGGQSVTVSGMLPEGVQLSISKTAVFPDEDSSYDTYGFDISILRDGAEWQPSEKVTVTIEGIKIYENPYLVVDHILDSVSAIQNGQGTMVTDPEIVALFPKERQAAFEATGVSNAIYAETFSSTVGTVWVAGDNAVGFATGSFSTYYIRSGNSTTAASNTSSARKLPTEGEPGTEEVWYIRSDPNNAQTFYFKGNEGSGVIGNKKRWSFHYMGVPGVTLTDTSGNVLISAANVETSKIEDVNLVIPKNASAGQITLRAYIEAFDGGVLGWKGGMIFHVIVPFGITFNANNGTIDGKSTVTYSDRTYYWPYDTTYNPTVTCPTPTRTGYTFGGWSGNGTTYSAGQSFTYTGDESITLTAQWTPTTYTATFNANGGSVNTTSRTFNIEGALSLPTPTRTGYTFTGWKVASAAGNWKNGDTYSASTSSVAAGKYGDVTLTAQWDAVTNAVTYEYAGTHYPNIPALPTTKYYSYNSSVSVEATPTLTGYTFSGWTTNDVTVSDGKFTMPDKTVTFSGYWTANTNTKYTVETYLQNLDGNDYTKSSEGKTGTTGATVNASTAAPAGFSYNASKSTVSGTVKADGSLVLKVYFDRNSYKVSYMYGSVVPANAPAVPAEATVKYGAAVSVAAEPAAVPGYTFHGWTTSDATVTNGSFTMPAEAVEFTGKWTPIEYIATFDYGDGLENKTTTFNIEDAITLPTLKKVGYTYEWKVTSATGNWIDGKSYTGASVEAGMYGDVTFTAQWTPISYTVRFTGGTGTTGTVSDISAQYDADVTLPDQSGLQRNITVTYVDRGETKTENLTATFNGWKLENAGSVVKPGDKVKNLTATANGVVTYYADWTLKSTTVPDIERIGYTLTWVTDGGTVLQPGDSFTPTQDVKLTAQWEAEEYTITYDYAQDGVNDNIFNYTIENNVHLETPSREGYEFKGWKLENANGTNWDAKIYAGENLKVGTGKFGDVILVAQWEGLYNYTLKFDRNGGDENSPLPEEVVTGWVSESPMTFAWEAEENPTRENYDFKGWALSPDSTENVAGEGMNAYTVTGEKNQPKEVTLYAIWERQTGDLKLTFNGGETAPAIVTVSGEGLNITVVLTKAETVIQDLPTGAYTVTAVPGNASYTASVTESNPQIKDGETTTVGVSTGSRGLNWFTAFFRVKNKCQ